MAFDGIMMAMVRRELTQTLLGARVAQIYQPARDELVFSFRTREGTKKLLIRLGDGGRVHLTETSIENPATPPMMCMLLRKRLAGAYLRAVEQPAHERILCLTFEALSEIGDRESLRLYVEIMGRYSNAVLVGHDECVIDSIRRIDFSVSEERVLLPKMPYTLPRMQDKLCITACPIDEIADRIIAAGGTEKAILATVQGISPIIAREIAHRAAYTSLKSELIALREIAQGSAYHPTLVYREDGAPMDTAFMPITQYGDNLPAKSYETIGALMDAFYAERDRKARIKAKTADLSRLLSNAVERLSRKINLQRADLKKCADREQLRIKGDLLQANLYRIDRGASSVTVENFYDENGGELTIRLNPAISPAANAQRFYKEYNKAKTREQKLGEQIALACDELAYIESVQDTLSRADSEQELAAIRAELTDQGYIRAPKGGKRRDKPMPPIEYRSSDGYRILVGRNNRQNDLLTLHTAAKGDIWLHTKNIPGSHTIIVCNGTQPSETAIRQAAQLAAYHSKGRDSSQVPVDYTQVKNVSKPAGAKPGKVIYVKYNTVYVTPQAIPFSGSDRD